MKKRLTAVRILFFFMIVGVLTPVFADNYQEEMSRADALMEGGQYLEAVAAYQVIAERAGEADIRARAILHIGDAYGFFLNNYDLALNKYWLLKRDYPRSSEVESAYFNSGMIYYERRQYKEALQQFKTYVKNYPRGDRRETAAFMMEACMKPPGSKGPKADRRIRTDEAGERTASITIRVIIGANVPEVRVKGDYPFTVSGGQQVDAEKECREAVIRAADGRLFINDLNTSVREIQIKPAASKPVLEVNGKLYRGLFKIQTSSSGLNIINVLDVESYLYGVIPKEMSPQWPLEALKAQSVAARSFALYQKAKNGTRPYDVAASTGSQVYGGYAVESPMANRAVDETKGVVMLYNGEPALAYFHANSGGMTEDAGNVWSTEIPYLKSIRDEPSAKAPNISWSASLSPGAIKQSLNKHGVRISAVTGIRSVRTSASGRVTKIGISSPEGEIVLDGNDFRMKIDPSVIKSTLFTVSSDRGNGDGTVRFEGRGSGHGVGMSQWGAQIMARGGSNYRDILVHYYPGVEIVAP